MRKFTFRVLITLGLVVLGKERRESFMEALDMGIIAHEKKRKEFYDGI